MTLIRILSVSALLTSGFAAWAQPAGQPEVKIDSANRTLSISAEATVTVAPDVAILHIGFETQPGDVKSAYAEGARTSNAIVTALRQAGVADNAIHSESQYLERDFTKPHRFKLAQQWTVRTTPDRAAEILDVAVTAGATSGGEIDWTVKDEPALEAQALDRAAARAREEAAVLAKGMGVRLGPPIYITNQLSTPVYPRPLAGNVFAMARSAAPAQPLAIEPHRVSRQASVYAVFAIE
ncbi:MAG: SIMPL domain-containing protein [Terracidiphilus sp.]